MVSRYMQLQARTHRRVDHGGRCYAARFDKGNRCSLCRRPFSEGDQIVEWWEGSRYHAIHAGRCPRSDKGKKRGTLR